MYYVLNKDIIESEIICHLPIRKRRWCKEGIWKKCWIEFLKKYKYSFDFSMVNLDENHLSCTRGGEEFAYQDQKKRKTTNVFYLKQGIVGLY